MSGRNNCGVAPCHINGSQGDVTEESVTECVVVDFTLAAVAGILLAGGGRVVVDAVVVVCAGVVVILSRTVVAGNLVVIAV